MRIETSFLFDLDGTLVDSDTSMFLHGKKRLMLKASNVVWRSRRSA